MEVVSEAAGCTETVSGHWTEDDGGVRTMRVDAIDCAPAGCRPDGEAWGAWADDGEAFGLHTWQDGLLQIEGLFDGSSPSCEMEQLTQWQEMR